MTELAANGAWSHETGSLRVSWGGSVTKRADVLGALRSYMFSRVALEASHGGGSGRFVGDNDGVAAGARFHNHLQSSGEHSTSIAHAWSSSSVTSTPTSLSWCSVSAVVFSRGEQGGATRGKRKGLLGQLWDWIDGSVSGR